MNHVPVPPQDQEAQQWAEKRAGHRQGNIAFSDLVDAFLAGQKSRELPTHSQTEEETVRWFMQGVHLLPKKEVYRAGLRRGAEAEREKNKKDPYERGLEAKLAESEATIASLKALLREATSALVKAEQFMVTTNLERARLRGDFQSVSEVLKAIRASSGPKPKEGK